MVVKTFRGLIANGGQDHIRLQTIKGKVGYRIIKFQLMPDAPGTLEHELVCKIYKTKQTSIDGLIDFSENTILGVSIMAAYAPTAFISTTTTVFDSEIFNQDIYVTAVDTESNSSTNYYLELEAIPLTDQGAEYTTLKDIRTQLKIS